ncbi:quinoprotein dehydrogenase-associated putative ABC transporter substrate-binding protein [Thalassococcus profundi]|uniref:Quinoprotein dehydrogenase-associated putative ABC transporter substrate-binding protein n=1 Tax=Thalassococcus profundi TaxID=2282382 RepID=A0A369TFD3_9RHOB|nr:substrate-binding domain-containing protein [Thalassococcus profundi]RDD64081.1 quinoprotein dehydrogenase-associated putative ABC transporter substrate-binding protein [Thalassococcus profundi]
MPAWAKSLLSAALVSVLCFSHAGPGQAQTSDLVSKNAFRVCADPANTPMSNRDETGYENKLAELIASKLDLPVEYEWYPMATGFIRNTLGANRCDVVIGYAQGHELVQNTNHYFTSVFTIVTKTDSALADVDTLSDPQLKDARIGIVAGSPPADHMARNGLLGSAKPYNLVVDRRYESPVLELLDDVKSGETDAAILWGPLAGPLVKTDYPGLQVTPLVKETLPPRLFFRITMGVRMGEKVWERELNSLIRRHQDEINQLLVEAGVPLANDMGDAMLEIGQ